MKTKLGAWRQQDPTPKQCCFLEKEGLWDPFMNRGEAADMISQLKKQNKEEDEEDERKQFERKYKRMKKRKRIPLLSDEEL